ncbi:hypothetical protein BGZ72_001452 [Mortierella alpina]|nr:hypothetical protein BGZ72_001452 [Mortierella alpina]
MSSFFTRNCFSHDKVPDLKGKIAIVTGANTGLGYWTTVSLAAHGAHVFLACRNEQRAKDAIVRARQEIKDKFPDAPSDVKLEFLELDLADMNSCQRSAETFLATGLPLHILVNNSGVKTSFELSVQGIENHFAVNHLGHFIFTMGLLDRIKESQPSRIVILTSFLHEYPTKGGIDFESLNDPTKSIPLTRYGRSKLANILFGKALARRLTNEKVYVNMVNPGIVATDIARSAKDMYGTIGNAATRAIMFLTGMTPQVGSLTQLYVATSPEIELQNIRGEYFVPIARKQRSSKYTLDEDLQERLWEFSEKLVRENLGPQGDK